MPTWWSWQACQAIVEILALVVTTAYVYVTYRMFQVSYHTFKEIKLQTDLQTVALLSIGARVEHPDGPSRVLPLTTGIIWNLNVLPSDQPARAPDTFDSTIADGHRRWRNILSQQTPPVPLPDRVVRLAIRNRGQSDVVSWRLQMKAEVEPGPHLSHLPVKNESYEWTVESKGEGHIVEVGGEGIDVCVAPTGSFPMVRFTWSLEYTDVRGVKYTRFVGDREIVDANPFAKPPPAQDPVGALPAGPPSAPGFEKTEPT